MPSRRKKPPQPFHFLALPLEIRTLTLRSLAAMSKNKTFTMFRCTGVVNRAKASRETNAVIGALLTCHYFHSSLAPLLRLFLRLDFRSGLSCDHVDPMCVNKYHLRYVKYLDINDRYLRDGQMTQIPLDRLPCFEVVHFFRAPPRGFGLYLEADRDTARIDTAEGSQQVLDMICR